jgi:3-oxoacyl-[acyl-carrier-protein] synthase III
LKTSAGMLSLSVAFPPLLRLNGYWEEKYPQLVSTARERSLARVWDAGTDAPRDPFTLAMTPFLKDPFRGAIARRFLAPGQSALDLEADAATQALNAAGLGPLDIDLTLVASFLPDQIGVGNAAFLAERLGLSGNAWNIESACAGGLAGLETACAFVKSGQAERVLVVVSCSYSRALDETDSLIWSVGDGAAAFVIGKVRDNEGLLAFQGFHTGETCGTMFYELESDKGGVPALRMKASDKSGKILRETAERYVLECCERVLEKADLRLNDIDFFVTATPMAWYSRFTSSVLGFEQHQTIDTHPLYANTGPVLVPTNLHAAAAAGRIHPGNLVLLYGVGSVSSRAAAVVRWGDVRLGPLPAEGVLELPVAA